VSFNNIILNIECRVKLSYRKKALIKKKLNKIKRGGARRRSISWISKMSSMSARQTVLHAVRLFIHGRAQNWAIVAKEKSRRTRAFDWILVEGKKFQFRRRIHLRGATWRHMWQPHPASEWNIDGIAGHKSALKELARITGVCCEEEVIICSEV